MKLLVTGGAGFIGSHFIRRMLSREHLVCCVDSLPKTLICSGSQTVWSTPTFYLSKRTFATAPP